MLGQLAQSVIGMAAALAERADGWVNTLTGFGTARDKTTAAQFMPSCFLTDVELSWLYSYDDLAATIVDIYPEQAMRLGFGLKGVEQDLKKDLDDYLKPFDLITRHTDARIWGRNYGGSAVWVMVDDGLDASEPLDTERIRTVLGLRTIDRRWLIPQTFYLDGPKIGDPELYRVQEPHPGGVPATLGYLHESRLVVYPGARTETLEKIRMRGWDHSVLLKVHEALRSSGQVWKACEILMSDANQGVLSINGLYEMIMSQQNQQEPSAQDPTGGGLLQKRARIFDQTRSVSRSILLDKDRETFERKPTTFTGVADMSDRAWKRVAAAARVPVTILMGESPAGLNATGDMDLRWFFAQVDKEREQIDAPRLLRLMRILLAAKDAPKLPKTGEASDPIDSLGIAWLPLWAPSAKELSEIRLARAQEAQLWIANQVFTTEEIALSIPEDWIGMSPEMRELREEMLAEDAQTLVAQRQQAEIAKTNAQLAGSEAAEEAIRNPPPPDEIGGNVPNDGRNPNAPATAPGPRKPDMPDNTNVNNSNGNKTQKNKSTS